MCIINLTKGFVSIVDDGDVNFLSKYKWYYSKKGYAVTNIDGKKQYMHRMIMNEKNPHIKIDHINGIKIDNRRINLRLCDSKYNSYNSKAGKNNLSGFKGVSWSKNAKKWRATIKFNYKQIHLGYFDNKEAAARRYDIEAELLFGEFARKNYV